MLTHTSTFSGYSINDTEAAKKFYGEVLGLAVEQTEEGLNITPKNGGSLFLYEKKNHTPATFTVFNFVVPDIDEAVDELVEQGVTFERYPEMPGEQDEKGIMRGKEAGMGPDIAWFKDPAGNILSVLAD